MGRGGRGGGSRSSGGGGGSRSSGGRIHSSSGGRGGRSSGSSSSGSSFSSHSSGHSYHSSHYYGGGSYGGGGGCLFGSIRMIVTVFLFLVALAVLVALFQSCSHPISAGMSVTRSTVEREALSGGVVNETDYYTDELGWIKNPTELKKGMKHFYKKTGVQPYLYLTDTIYGETTATQENMDAYARDLYDELFTDEAHLLLLFHEYDSSSDYSTWYVCGSAAKTVIDEEAANILLDYVDRYYYADIDEDKMFSKVFQKTADRIMFQNPIPGILKTAAIIIGVIVVSVIVLIIVIVILIRKRDRAKETERILNMDLKPIPDEDDKKLSDLEEKYK